MKKLILMLATVATIAISFVGCKDKNNETISTPSESVSETIIEMPPVTEPQQVKKGIKYKDSDGNEYRVVRRLIDKSEQMQVVFQNTKSGKVNYMPETRFEESYTAIEYSDDALDDIKGDLYVDKDGYTYEVIIRYRIYDSAMLVLFLDVETRSIWWAYEGDFKECCSPVKE